MNDDEDGETSSAAAQVWITAQLHVSTVSCSDNNSGSVHVPQPRA